MKKIIILICFIALSLTFFGTIQQAHAAIGGLGTGNSNYTPLAPLDHIRSIDVSSKESFANYINLTIKIAIGLAGVLAVVMIIAGGIEYMGSDSVFSKGEGMKKIQNSLLGILLALSCYLILNTINPQLLNISIDLKGKENAPITPGLNDIGLVPAPEGGYVYYTDQARIDTDGATPPPFNDPTYKSETSKPGLDANSDYYAVVPIGSSIPLGTPVTIRNNETGKFVTGIVGDRGPSLNGHGEISLAAAREIGVWRAGDGNSARQVNISIIYDVK